MVENSSIWLSASHLMSSFHTQVSSCSPIILKYLGGKIRMMKSSTGNHTSLFFPPRDILPPCHKLCVVKPHGPWDSAPPAGIACSEAGAAPAKSLRHRKALKLGIAGQHIKCLTPHMLRCSDLWLQDHLVHPAKIFDQGVHQQVKGESHLTKLQVSRLCHPHWVPFILIWNMHACGAVLLLQHTPEI